MHPETAKILSDHNFAETKNKAIILGNMSDITFDAASIGEGFKSQLRLNFRDGGVGPKLQNWNSGSWRG